MRKIFLTLLFLLSGVILLNAQTGENPFAKYGFKKVRAYTSSKGEFEEFHDNKDIVEIGSVLFDTKTNQVIGYAEEEVSEVAAATPAMSIDPLCEKYYWISPYSYCANNPVKYIDPDGRDWVLRDVDGKAEYYYDRSVTSQGDVNRKYGKNSGVVHIATGTVLTVYPGGNKTQYTFVNDAKENKYGTVLDSNGNTMDNSSIIKGNSFTIFGTTNESVNAETLYKNYFGSSYIGRNNPKTYGDGTERSIEDSYQYFPEWGTTEMAAYNHDIAYDALGVRGPSGAISSKTTAADMVLISDCKRILDNPRSSSQEKSRARYIIAGFTFILTFK